MSREVVVVGGGIVGSSVAYHCARRGLDTLLVDRGDEGRATDAGAGIVSPATSSRTGSEAWFRLGVAAAEYYPDLVERLDEEQDGAVGYDEPGILVVATAPAEADALDRSLARIRDRQARMGVPAAGTVEEVSPETARDRLPVLGAVEGAFTYSGAGRVDGRTFTDALQRAGLAHGLDVARESAETVDVERGGVTGVGTDEGRYAADVVVVAGGAWSSSFGDDLGVDLPVEPMRGQIAHLETSESTDQWPMVGGFRGHYLVPWPGGRVAAGATREEDAGYDPRTTAAGVREVLDEALRVAPGLGDATLSTVRVGLRPASPDGLPVLGPVPGVEGAFVATGHGPTGLTLGPYSGRILSELIRGEEPDVNLGPFSPDRF